MARDAVLVIDTAAAQCAVALACNGALHGERREAMTRGHAERLVPLIEALLRDAGARVGDISGIVACTGPGGFSGARIGVAAARGLALALGRPAVGVSWFQALACAHRGRVLVSLPAGSGAVHVQRFDAGVALDDAATVAEGSAVAGPGEILLTLDRQSDDPLMLLARAGAALLARGAQPRPAPLYMRPPDALPSGAATPRRIA